MIHKEAGIWKRPSRILQHKSVKDREDDFAVNHGVSIDFREVGIAEIRRASETPPVIEVWERHIGESTIHPGKKTVGE